MNELLKKEQYDGFDYPVSELVKYIRAGDIFTIMLKDSSIIHYTINIKEADLFEKWLANHNVSNITPDKRSGKNQI